MLFWLGSKDDSHGARYKDIDLTELLIYKIPLNVLLVQLIIQS